jgi:alpha-1,2-mannosyltransferase
MPSDANPTSQMALPSRRRLIAIALICGVFGLFSAAVCAINFPRHPGVGQDWMVFYTAARAYLDGYLPLLYDADRLTAHMEAAFADWLGEPLGFHPWVYPPPFLLLLIPFGFLSFGLSYPLFMLATFGCLLAAIWRLGGAGYRPWLLTFSLLLAPATAYAIGTGQNSFLTAALLIGGFGLLGTQPVLAGMLLGSLIYKPQFCLLIPIALVAARQWRPLISAITTGSLLALASIAVLGIEPWRMWFEWISGVAADYQKWLTMHRLLGESIYTNLTVLGASHSVANAGQALVALVAMGCVWWCYRRPAPRDLRLVVLLSATVLAAPHILNYDAVLLVAAATLLVIRALDDGFRRGELIVPMLVWMIQLFNPPSFYRFTVITPVLTALLILCAMRRLGAKTAMPWAGFGRNLARAGGHAR